MFAYLESLRPLNCLMSIIAVLVGGFLILNTIDFVIIYAAIAVFLITGAGNVINDYVDIEADKINRPNRPIPSGRISKKSALIYAILLFAIGIIISGFINWLIFIIAIVNSLLLVLYSTHLQNKIFVGNILVAYLTASTFLFGGAAAFSGSFQALSLPLLLMLLSGLATFSREIVKDIEDLEGDKIGFFKKIKSEIKAKLKTKIFERFGIGEKGISLRYTERKAGDVAIVSLFLTLIVSPLPYLLGILSLTYLVMLVPTDIVFAASIYELATRRGKKKYKNTQKLIKLGMFLGLISFIMGVIF